MNESSKNLAAQKYRRGFFYFERQAGSDGVVAIQADTKSKIPLSKEEAGLLLYSDTFQTLPDHIEFYVRRFPLYSSLRQGLAQAFEKLVAGEFLLEANTYSQRLAERARRAVKQQVPSGESRIEMVGIPTANRPEHLEAALSSLIKNLARFERTPEIVIADDSEPESLAKNTTLIEGHRKKYKGTIRHLDLKARQEMADELSKAIGAPADIVRFSICGDETTKTRTGALRNAILLAAAGKKLLSIDDDVIVNVHMPPKTEDELLLTSSPPRLSWLFDGYEEALGYFPSADIDYLAAHETLLGKNAAEAILENSRLSWDDAAGTCSDDLVAALSETDMPDARVRTTYSGAVGHSWMRVHSPGMIDSPDRMHGLWGDSAESYRARRQTPFIGRTTDCPALYRGPNCISLNLGLDCRALLPPFTPLYRSQDAVFGYMLDRTEPGAVAGFVRPLVEHRRDEVRLPQSDPARNYTTVGKLFIAALATCRISLSTKKPADALRELGAALRAGAARPLDDFAASGLVQCSAYLRGFAESCRNLLSRHPEGPDYWKEDLTAVINGLEARAADPASAFLFWDEKSWSADHEKGWNGLRDLARDYGRLLEHWPDIFDAAKEKNRRKGQPLVKN